MVRTVYGKVVKSWMGVWGRRGGGGVAERGYFLFTIWGI